MRIINPVLFSTVKITDFLIGFEWSLFINETYDTFEGSKLNHKTEKELEKAIEEALKHEEEVQHDQNNEPITFAKKKSLEDN